MTLDASDFPICAHCSDRIGAYEPLCLQRPDGSVSSSSLLRVREDPAFGAPGARLFHRACYDDAPPTSPLSSA